MTKLREALTISNHSFCVSLLFIRLYALLLISFQSNILQKDKLVEEDLRLVYWHCQLLFAGPNPAASLNNECDFVCR